MKTKINKYIIIILLAFTISISPINAQKSHAWMSMPAASYKEMLEELFDKIKGIMLGILKQQAVNTINSQIDSAIGGSSGSGAKFITNWENYLVKNPKSNTDKYINDYLSNVTSGKGSLSGYSSSEGFGSGSSSYASNLVSMAKKATSQYSGPQFTYEGDPANMFSDGTFKKMNLYLSDKYINTPSAFVSNAESVYISKMAEEKRLAQTKATAYQGFIGTGEDASGKGTIKTPGSLTMQMTANAKDVGNKVVASAQHPEEVITALVSQMITKAIGQGISMSSSSLQGLSSSLTSSLSSQTSSSGPSATYNTNYSSYSSSASTSSGSSSSGSSDSSSSSSSRSGGVPPPARNW